MQKITTMAKRYNNREEAMEFLKSLPVNALIEYAADLMMATQMNSFCQKITLTEEQFKEHFRIRGVNDNGERETRGRKPKND